MICLFQAVSESVNQQEDDSLLKCLVELAESVPKFIRPQVENVLTFCMKVRCWKRCTIKLLGLKFFQHYFDDWMKYHIPRFLVRALLLDINITLLKIKKKMAVYLALS